MFQIIKKEGKKVQAYRLGDANKTLEKLMEEGKIRPLSDGEYEVFSQESINGTGQLAKEGDYIKIDSSGYPYPNKREFFLTHHKLVKGDCYEQIPKPLWAWTIEEPMCREIEFLTAHKGLRLCPETPDKYFNAFLWGAMLSAPRDATLVFYEIQRDDAGEITNAEFNFVAKIEFEQIYRRFDSSDA